MSFVVDMTASAANIEEVIIFLVVNPLASFFAPITYQYTITSEAKQLWITGCHRYQRDPIPQAWKVSMDILGKSVSLF